MTLSISPKHRAERAAERAAEAERIVRQQAQEALLNPGFDPVPQTDFEAALAQAITAGADNLRNALPSGTPSAQVVAARTLYAAEADALYTRVRAEFAASPRALSSWEIQATLLFVKRELDAIVTRSLAAIDTIRRDAQQHLPVRLYNFLKAERAKRDRYTRTITISNEERAAELGLPPSLQHQLPPGTVVPGEGPKATIGVVPPLGHPDRARVLAELGIIQQEAPVIPETPVAPTLAPAGAARWGTPETEE